MSGQSKRTSASGHHPATAESPSIQPDSTGAEASDALRNPALGRSFRWILVILAAIHLVIASVFIAKQVRDLLHIGDLVHLVQMQADRIGGFRSEVFHAGGGTVANLSLRETTELCREITGREVPVAETEEERPADVIWYVTDNRRTTDVFGWAPVRDARTILQDTHDWLRGHEDAFRSVFGG